MSMDSSNSFYGQETEQEEVNPSVTKCHRYVLISFLLCDMYWLHFNVNLGSYATRSGYSKEKFIIK